MNNDSKLLIKKLFNTTNKFNNLFIKNKANTKLKSMKHKYLETSKQNNIYLNKSYDKNYIKVNNNVKNTTIYKIRKKASKSLLLNKINFIRNLPLFNYKIKNYQLVYTFKDITGNKPSSCLDPYLFSYKNNILLFHGEANKITNDIWIYNIEKNKWYKFYYDNKCLKSCEIIMAQLFKNNIYIYTTKNKINMKKNKDFMTMYIYNIDKNMYTFKEYKHIKSLQKINYSNISHNMIYFLGGYNKNNNKVNKYIYLQNLKTLKCIKVNIKNFMPNGLTNFTTFSYYTDIDDDFNYLINNEFFGIYLLWGLDLNGNEINNLYKIKFKLGVYNKIYAKLKKVDYKGRTPLFRYDAKAVVLSKLKTAIIMGGRNNNVEEISDYYINQVLCYNIESSTFYNVTMQKNNFIFQRINFGITTAANSIFIFGGIDNDGFKENNIIKVQVDVRKIQTNNSSNNKRYKSIFNKLI